jgi:serine phosphatase RsbU (regulator of sigma subunit)
VDSTLLLYTDGLLEQLDVPAAATVRPGGSGTRDLDTGLARLTDLLAGSAGLDLEDLCDLIMTTLLPPAGAADDVALLAIRPYAEDQPRPPQAGPNVVP